MHPEVKAWHRSLRSPHRGDGPEPCQPTIRATQPFAADGSCHGANAVDTAVAGMFIILLTPTSPTVRSGSIMAFSISIG
jgi:hypothetical protein